MTNHHRPPNWRSTKLKNVCNDVTVGHVGPMASQYVESGIPFLRSQNIEPFRLNRKEIKYITAEFHAKLKKSALKPGDVAVVRTGYPGTACVIPNDLPVSNCADLVVIRPSESINAHFLAAIFNSAWGRGAVAGNLVGVAQQHFNVGAAKELEFALPPIGIQRKIAGILSAYDDLIENNTRRIAILEEMAQAIYREWFVHFRFPGHENAKFVDSPLGRIPEGWKKPLGDVVTLKRGYDLPQKERRLGSVPLVSSSGITDLHDKAMVRGPGVVTGRYGTLGEVFYIHQDFWPLNTTLYVRDFHENEPLIVVQLLRSLNLATQNSAGAVPGVNRNALHMIDVAFPPLHFQEMIRHSFNDIEGGVRTLCAKNANLCSQRDLLLPHLINGQLDVEQLDIDAGEPLEMIEA